MDYQEARRASIERMNNAWRDPEPVKATKNNDSAAVRNNDAPPTVEDARRAMIERAKTLYRTTVADSAGAVEASRETPEDYGYQNMIDRIQNLYKGSCMDAALPFRAVPCVD